MEKICSKCNISKPIDQFKFDKRDQKHYNPCKSCRNKQSKEYYDKNKNIDPNENKKVEIGVNMKICNKCKVVKELNQFPFDKKCNTPVSPCKECRSIHDKKKRQNDPNYAETRRKKVREYWNRADIQVKMKQKYLENVNKPEFIKRQKERSAKYYEKNKEIILKRNQEREQKRYMTDINFQLRKNLRSRLYIAVKSKGLPKLNTTINLLGCNYDYLKKWLESQFDSTMTWDNYGEIWVVDHVKPCASFDLTKEELQKECFNWKNLRPFEKKENLVKNAKIDDELILKIKTLAESFQKANPIN